MKKDKKHTAPWRCRRKVRLQKPDPINFAICDIGAGGCKRCEGCEHYKPNKVRDDIIQAADRLKEKLSEFERAFTTLKFSLLVPSPKHIYELAEEEPEEEDKPWPKINPYIQPKEE